MKIEVTDEEFVVFPMATGDEHVVERLRGWMELVAKQAKPGQFGLVYFGESPGEGIAVVRTIDAGPAPLTAE